MPRNRRVVVVTTVVVVAVALVAALVWWFVARDDADPAAAPSPSATSAAPTPTATPSPTASATTDPAEPAPAPAEPAEPEEPGTDPVAPAPGLAMVDVVTTYAGWNATSGAVEVGAYAAAVEAGATCTLTLTQGGATVSAEGAATPDVSTTACGDLAVTRDRLAAGTWQAVVRYESATSSGVSAPVTVEVP